MGWFENAIEGAGSGALAGSAFGGPLGAGIGAAIGGGLSALLGSDVDPAAAALTNELQQQYEQEQIANKTQANILSQQESNELAGGIGLGEAGGS